MTKVNEIFVPVKGYEGYYEISNLGRLKSVERIDCRGQRRKEMIKAPVLDSKGYHIYTLSKDKIKRTIKAHRLIASHFIPNPESKPFINHIDNNTVNNSLDNLEWCTAKENSEHCVNQGRKIGKRGSSSHFAKLTESQVLEIYHSEKSVTQLAIDYNIVQSAVSNIKQHRRWKHITQRSQ